MKKGAIFDLDGTLAASMGVWERVDYNIAEKYGFEPDEDYWNNVTSRSYLEGAEYITDRYKLDITPQEMADEIFNMVLNDYRYNIELKEGAEKLLEKMKKDGIKMAVATSNSREMTEALLKNRKVIDYFDTIVYSQDIGVNKTEPDIYIEAAKRLGLDISECYVFEDMLYAINGAKKSAAEVIAVYDVFSEEDIDAIKITADKFIMSLEEFQY